MRTSNYFILLKFILILDYSLAMYRNQARTNDAS